MSEVKLADVFPFEYVGGGYFRKKGVPKGEAAEILHGEQAVRYLFDQLTHHDNSLQSRDASGSPDRSGVSGNA